MTITLDADFLALIAVGLLAGSLAAIIFDRSSTSWLRNIVIGVGGAFVGSFVFDVLGLRDNIPEIFSGTITLADVLVAFVGAAIIMVIARRFL